MSKWVIDIHGELEGDYDLIKKYEEQTIEAIPKADYETRLKADMVTMLEELNLEIDEMFARRIDYTVDKIQDLIQQKINALKENDNGFNEKTSN